MSWYMHIVLTLLLLIFGYITYCFGYLVISQGCVALACVNCFVVLHKIGEL